ncbi:tetratricopeptide repeat family protein, partial [Lyngbya aestuarii BL J]
RLPQQWLSILSVNSIFLLNLGFPLLTLPITLHRGEVIAQTDPNAEALRLYRQGVELFQQGTAESYQQAIVVLEKALQLYQQAGNLEGQAWSLLGLGRISDLLGDKQQALEFYNQSLPLSRQVGDIAEEANTLRNLAILKGSQGNLSEALTDIESAISIIEELRTKIISQDLRTSYFSTVYGYYEFYIDLLMELHEQNPNQGYDAKALHASERGRARSLLDILAESGADIKKGVDPQLLA